MLVDSLNLKDEINVYFISFFLIFYLRSVNMSAHIMYKKYYVLSSLLTDIYLPLLKLKRKPPKK